MVTVLLTTRSVINTTSTVPLSRAYRPSDNYVNISQYQMRLEKSINNGSNKHDNDSFVSNQSLDVDKIRNTYMYIFVNLIPGTRYTFKVRACSTHGCGNWSPEIEATTADGHADSPENVLAHCTYNSLLDTSSVNVTWDAPVNARGKIVGYNVSIEGYSSYRNEEVQVALDKIKEVHHISGNKSRSFQTYLRANTNYTFRVCTVNGQGCGWFSQMHAQSQCSTPSSLPVTLPSADDIRVSLVNPRDKTSRRIKLTVPRVSERNGVIKCYRIIMIRLPHDDRSIDLLPQLSRLINVSTYEAVHADILKNSVSHSSSDIVSSSYSPSSSPLVPSSSSIATTAASTHVTTGSSASVTSTSPSQPSVTLPGAYVAEQFLPDSTSRDVIIGDDNYISPLCDTRHGDDNRYPRRIKSDHHTPDSPPLVAPQGQMSEAIVDLVTPLPSLLDGVLAPATNYTGFLEVQVMYGNIC